jgi:ABC-type uncharacterized transport system substrate-binding protein
MNVRIIRFIFILGILSLGTSPLWAHPHIWISSTAEVVVKDGVVKGYWATWTFDEMFSTVMTGFPHHSDGTFNPATQRAIMQQDFRNLRNYQYFCWVYWNGHKLPIPRVDLFKTWLVDGGTRAVYHFFVSIDRKIHPGDELTLAMYDDSYYTQILWAKKDPVKIDGADARVVFRPNDSRAYYGGFVIPVEAHIYWR